MNELQKIEFQKSLQKIKDRKQLEYFKRELIKVLEAGEDKVSKAIEDYDRSIAKTFREEFGIEKSRGYGIGTIREWKGRKYKKIAPNKWRLVYESNSRGARQSIAYLKKAVMDAKTTDELLEIVMQNINRFQDANGKTLDIVSELQNAVKESKTRISSLQSMQKEKTIESRELRFENLPETAYDTPDKEKLLKSVINKINEIEPVNPVLSRIYNLFINNINILYPDFKLTFTDKGNSCIPQTGEVKIDLAQTNDIVKSFVHEWMHLIDYKCGDNAYATKRNEELQSIIKTIKITDIPAKIQSAIFGDVVSDFRSELLSRIPKQLKLSPSSKDYKDAKFKNICYKRIQELNHKNEYDADKKINGENSALSDIMDALSGGKLWDLGLLFEGHGREEFNAVYNRASEIMSDYAALCFTKPKQVELLKTHYPELCEELDRSLNVYAKKLEEIIYG